MSKAPKAKGDRAVDPDLGTFAPLPKVVLDRLIAKGRKDAEELDKLIRSQFELSAADGALRLDS